MTDSPRRDELLAAKFCAIAVDSYRPHLGQLSLALIPAELEEANRFRRREDSERFIIGRALIRHLCASSADLEPRAITLLWTASGKPSLGSGEGLEFNVAHSGNCVLIAWSRSGPVGVDVEAARPGNRGLFMEMAKPAFSTQELALLHAATEAEMSEIFYRIGSEKRPSQRHMESAPVDRSAHFRSLNGSQRGFAGAKTFNSRLTARPGRLSTWTRRPGMPPALLFRQELQSRNAFRYRRIPTK